MNGMTQLFHDYIKPGKVGYYQGASITTVLLHDKKERTYHNVYTLVTFQETKPKNKNKMRRHSKKPLSINGYSAMILTQEVSINTAIDLYETFSLKGKWQQPDCPPLMTHKVRSLPPVFVPLHPHPPIVHGIKNPHRHCQYLFEFFAEDKSFWNDFSEVVRKQLADWVLEHLPIDLNLLSDRWGNLIFQLPVTLLAIDSHGDKTETDIHVHFRWHPNLVDQNPETTVYVRTFYDDMLLGSKTSSEEKNDHVLNVHTTDSELETTVVRNSDGMVLYQHQAGLIKDFDIRMSYGARVKREVVVPGGDSYQVHPYHRNGNTRQKLVDWKAWVQQRQHKESVGQLERKKYFVQYGLGKDKQAEHRQAIADIRQLVSQYGQEGAYLWDPYCDGIDILNTLYACQSYGAPLRVITSRSAAEDDKSVKISFEEKKENIIKQLKQGGNHEGINLEVRCQHGRYGWSFHDRFLLFPRKLSEPLVWSLGSSVNSIGKSHSILLKVEHAQPVLDAFQDLWEQLEEAVIWR